MIGRAYIARDCYSLLPGLVAKTKEKKMFKKNVKGMQQNIKAAFHLQKIFRGQERNGKFSADRNGKFSVVNFHFFFLALYFKSESKQTWPD